MMDTCQPGIYHQTTTSFSWSTDFLTLTSSFHDWVIFSIAVQPMFITFGPHIEHRDYAKSLTWTIVDAILEECQAPCTLKTIFVDSIKYRYIVATTK